jgi:NADH-quinone oxidoreductase subunit A
MYFLDFTLSIIILGFSLILLGLGHLVGSIFINSRESSYEKISSYECGFDAFSDSREPFDVKFYLIALLFIIFDVEVIFFFPYIMCMRDVFLNGFYTIMVFTIILMIGFGYEWRKGCMDWD